MSNTVQDSGLAILKFIEKRPTKCVMSPLILPQERNRAALFGKPRPIMLREE
jgi:hypothetical protein